ncbi:MAG: helix-turn-helix transcriptional regulator [Hyphomonas sp.]|jgi:phage repressor protein C with HTH and peptisase S24 domain|uniref:Phage repressor n=1 Tax=hydrothermal vent metagenome TaxID=652676 RepID=A0A160TXB1_9ZZZZ|nr:helix-turn-helix transcriptional regulator [Hyphomonas sp.]MDF1804984.1 helix-turn-helix transcriptional regulator [Hyphomonas sp.]
MKHRDIWRGLDALAAHHGLTPSGLARRAGLDPTAFNPSKREGADGRPRWPSTESLARVLESVGSRFEDFAALVDGRRGAIAPLIGFAQAGQDGFFDDAGFPVGGGWEEVRFPGLETESVYALEISGDSMEPAYRAGDRIIVSPGSEVKPGDRVVAKTVGGEVMAKVLARKNTRIVELASLNPAYPVRSFKPSEIAWLARILWASQ